MNIGDEFTLTFGEEKLKCQNVSLLYKGKILSWDDEDGGGAVVLRIENCTVVLTENKCAFTTPTIFKSIGLEIKDYKIIVVKLGYLYPELQKVATNHVIAKTRGASSVDIKNLPFTKIQRPCWPFDVFDWKA